MSKAEADAWLERYRAGEEVIPTPDPMVVFVAPGPGATCAPLPAQRPAGFEGYHFSSDSQVRQEPWHGFASGVCHFEWGSLHLDRPKARCTVLDQGALDRVYRELRQAQIWTIRTQEAKGANPDRPGWGVTIRWPGHRCSFVAWGPSEIAPGSEQAFRAVIDLLERVRRAGDAATLPPSTLTR